MRQKLREPAKLSARQLEAVTLHMASCLRSSTSVGSAFIHVARPVSPVGRSAAHKYTVSP